jgi:hypothetical protein
LFVLPRAQASKIIGLLTFPEIRDTMRE